MKKTTLRQNITNHDRKWYIIDAEGKNLGQLSVVIANSLRGKNRPDFTPHVDGGDYVIILNAEKVSVTGSKEQKKLYYRHSGYLGNLKTQTLAEVRQKDPLRIIRNSVSGMLPKTRLKSKYMERLILVAGDKNPHEAQKPMILELK